MKIVMTPMYGGNASLFSPVNDIDWLGMVSAFQIEKTGKSEISRQVNEIATFVESIPCLELGLSNVVLSS